MGPDGSHDSTNPLTWPTPTFDPHRTKRSLALAPQAHVAAAAQSSGRLAPITDEPPALGDAPQADTIFTSIDVERGETNLGRVRACASLVRLGGVVLG